MKRTGKQLFAVLCILSLIFSLAVVPTLAAPTPQQEEEWFTEPAVIPLLLSLKADGTVWFWGYNFMGEAGDPNKPLNTNVYVPTQVPGMTNVKSIAQVNNGLSIFAIKDDGSVWAWGQNTFGVLGIGSSASEVRTPTRVRGIGGSGYLSNVVKIVTSDNIILALLKDGTIAIWGNSTAPIILNNTGTSNANNPSLLKASSSTVMSNVKDIAGGGGCITILNNSNVAYHMGHVNYTSSSSSTPIYFPTQILTGIKQVSAFMALSLSGTIYTWGNNSFGQLGYGSSTTYSNTPTALSTISNIDEILTSVSDYHVVRAANGTTYEWGNRNSSNRIFTPTVTNLYNDSRGTIYKNIFYKTDGTVWINTGSINAQFANNGGSGFADVFAKVYQTPGTEHFLLFGVVEPPVIPPVDPPLDLEIVRVNNDDERVIYYQNWTYDNSTSSMHNGDQHFSDITGAYAEFTFTGTEISWIGAKSTNLGIAKVYIDGVEVAQVNQYGSSLLVQEVLFSKNDLPYGEHTIKIEVAGTSIAPSAGNYVTIDAFEYLGDLDEEVIETVLVNDDDASIDYHLSWTYSSGVPGMINEDQTYSSETGAYAELTFTGTGVKWIGATSSNFGCANVYIDGVLVLANFDLYSNPPVYPIDLYSINNLPYGAHTIKIEVTGNKNPASSGFYVSVDAFEVSKVASMPDPQETYTVNDDDIRVEYQPMWDYLYHIGLYNNDHRQSDVTGAVAEFTFTGTSISWIGAYSTNLGKANIYIDGVLEVAELDLYGDPVELQVVVFSKTDLPYGEHTIIIEVAGTRNPLSEGYYVTIDALEYVG